MYLYFIMYYIFRFLVKAMILWHFKIFWVILTSTGSLVKLLWNEYKGEKTTKGLLSIFLSSVIQRLQWAILAKIYLLSFTRRFLCHHTYPYLLVKFLSNDDSFVYGEIETVVVDCLIKFWFFDDLPDILWNNYVYSYLELKSTLFNCTLKVSRKSNPMKIRSMIRSCILYANKISTNFNKIDEIHAWNDFFGRSFLGPCLLRFIQYLYILLRRFWCWHLWSPL